MHNTSYEFYLFIVNFSNYMMCSPFEEYLENIADKISTPADNINYILNFVISMLRNYSSSFNMFFHKSISIGKYS